VTILIVAQERRADHPPRTALAITEKKTIGQPSGLRQPKTFELFEEPVESRKFLNASAPLRKPHGEWFTLAGHV
jgi:hypothetical protein